MAIETLLKYRNLDSTLDLNNQLAGFFEHGIVSGGVVAPAVGLNVTVTPFKLIGVDGMVVLETSATVTLAVQANLTNVIVFNAQYVSNDNPIAEFEVMSIADYNTAPNQAYLNVFAFVTVPNVTQVTAGMIDLSQRDEIDPVTRAIIRGALTNASFLPTMNNRPSDSYIISSGLGDNPAIYTWNGSSWINITDSLVVASLLNAHRNNLFSNEIHLTDTQAAAALGTYGVPGEQYTSNVVINIPTSIITLPSPPSPPLIPGLDVRFSTSPGGSLPTGLLVDTDYYAIPLTSTTLQVASSYANATALPNPIPIVLSGTQTGTPILFYTGNQYVTSNDPRMSTLAEAQALENAIDQTGFFGAPAGPTNPVVVASYSIAQPTALGFSTSPGNVLTIPPGDGPVYVGTGGAGTPLQWFKLYHATLQREYVNSLGAPVTITGIFIDVGLTTPLIPSSIPSVLSNFGFYNGAVYLSLTGTADLAPRLLYGQQETLANIDRGMFLRPGPYSAETTQETLERLEDISGRVFDDPVPADEENINLRISINLLRQYLNGVTASDLVLDSLEYPRMREVPELAPLFPFDPGENIYYAGGSVPYTASSTQSAVTSFDSYFSFPPNADLNAIAIINYSAPVTLTSVQPGHIFTDGDGIRYRILAVKTSGNGALMIYTGGQAVTTTLNPGSGAVTQANNPRQLELNDNQTSMFRDTIVINGTAPILNTFETLPPGGSATGTGGPYYTLIGTSLLPNQGNAAGAPAGRLVSYVTPEKQGNRYDQRIILIGNWKNDQTNYPRQAVGQVSQGCVGIEYTGYLTDITLFTAYDTTMPYGFRVFIDGVYTPSASQFLTGPDLTPGVAPSNIISKLRSPEITPQPLFFPLGLSNTQIHTVRIEITEANTGIFPLFGLETYYNTGLLETEGNVYLETDLVQLTSPDMEATPPPSQPVTLKGTRYTRYVERTVETRAVAINSIRTIIDTTHQPNSGNPTFTNSNVASGYIGDVYVFTDRTTSVGPPYDYVLARVVGISESILGQVTIEAPLSFNSSRLEFAFRIPARVSDGTPIVSAPTNTDEVEILRLGPSDWNANFVNDVSQLSLYGPDSKVTVLDDCSTSLLVDQCQLVSTGLEGYPTGIQMNSGSSVMVQQAFCTRMDVVFTGNSGPVSVDIEIDGLYTYTVMLTGSGLERHSLFLEGAPQSHVVKISNASVDNAVVVSQWIIHTVAPADYNGTIISDYITTRNITADGPFWDFTPLTITNPLTTSFAGVRVFDPTKGHARYYDGTAGSILWKTFEDFTKNPRFGYYAETDYTDAQVDIDVVGSHFEVYYEARPDGGISNVYINDLLFIPANFPTVALGGYTPAIPYGSFNFSNSIYGGYLQPGQLDLYAASNGIQRLIISGLPFGRYKISLQNTNTKNSSSSSFILDLHAVAENPGSGMVSRLNLDDTTNNNLHFSSFQDEREFVTLLPEQVGIVSGTGGNGGGSSGIQVLPEATSGLVDLSEEPYFFGVYCDWAMDADPIASPFSPVDSSPGYSPPSLYQGQPPGLLLSYDADRTYTASGNLADLDAIPSWAVNPTDLIGSVFQPLGASNTGVAILITDAVFTPVVQITLETSITTVATPQACAIKQCMHTKDLVQFKPGVAGNDVSVADRLPIPVPAEIQSVIQSDVVTIVVDSESSVLAGPSGVDPSYGTPLISFTGNINGLRTDGTTPDTVSPSFWSIVQTFPKYQEQTLGTFAPPSDTPGNNQRLFLRVFPAPIAGNGSVNLLRWAAVFFENLQQSSNLPVNTAFAFGYADNSEPSVNCTIFTNGGGKTQITFSQPYNFNAYPGTTDSILQVLIDGLDFPRATAGVVIKDGSFTELDSFNIQLDGNYSGTPSSTSVDIRYKQKWSQINIGTFSPVVWVNEGTVALTGAPFDAPRSIFEPRNFTQLRLSARNTGSSGTTTVQIYKNAVLVASGSLVASNTNGSNLNPILISTQPDDILTAQVSGLAVNCTDLAVELA
jgi:hypothetical protein